MKIYTRTGDDGTTSIRGNVRLSKDSGTIELLGSMDEASCALGIAKLYAPDRVADIIQDVQKEIQNICSGVAGFDTKPLWEKIQYIEDIIDRFQSEIPLQNGFIIPGKTLGSAYMDFARAVVRRAERKAVAAKADGVQPEMLKYLNRLSDLLYVLARYIDCVYGGKSAHEYNKEGGREIFLNLEIALKLIMISQALAKEMGIPIVSAVADEAGNLLALQRMDGALVASIGIAIDKAYTASTLRMPTDEIGNLAQPDGPLYGINTTNNQRIVTFAGGYPLKYNGTVVGGIGISGGTSQQDLQIAKAVALSYEELIKVGDRK
ncbi:cob(I)yrinic acid a,c-diamide adenosyltransferase [Caldanaerobius polysaccharolyticus]|uniref:cob(I)yrinic acid a,c-diamide adenosyltransferase n=1 Tax=Caldanaerobius polysaccharolyticus TaxID=44256 RepID=UPI00047EF0A7|nr:cob(I)yrinic acid a,c-diamide adenosyltransferase [Caldanaerobius polysaccharolyticus]